MTLNLECYGINPSNILHTECLISVVISQLGVFFFFQMREVCNE